MSLSQLARSIKESATLKLNETAAVLREKGEPVIHLGGGEPKSKAPVDAIINCLHYSIQERSATRRLTEFQPSRKPSFAIQKSITRNLFPHTT